MNSNVRAGSSPASSTKPSDWRVFLSKIGWWFLAGHLLYNDKWKEQFLQEIENDAIIELYNGQQYKLIGMPFYNKGQREQKFTEKLNHIISSTE